MQLDPYQLGYNLYTELGIVGCKMSGYKILEGNVWKRIERLRNKTALLNPTSTSTHMKIPISMSVSTSTHVSKLIGTNKKRKKNDT
jgi:hypothetical protein